MNKQARKGKYNLWYVEGVNYGFVSEEKALEHIRLKDKPLDSLTADDEHRDTYYSHRAATRNTEDNFWGVFLYLLWFVLAVTVLWRFLQSSPEVKNVTDRVAHNCRSVFSHHVNSEELIKDHLNLTNPIRLSAYRENHSVYIGYCRVQHVGYVDVKVKSGPTQRHRYVSVTRYHIPSGQYRLESLQF